MKPRIAVLFGGPSVEHEVSVISARGVLENIDREAYFPLPVYQDRQGGWHGPEELRATGRPVIGDIRQLIALEVNHDRPSH